MTHAPHHPDAPRRAYALLDVITAAVVLGISLATILSLTGRAMTSQMLGEELQTAALLADEHLNLVLARGPDNYASRFSLTGQCSHPFERFRYQLDFRGGAGGNPYVVTATIHWLAGGGGVPRSASIQTFIATREGDDPDPDRRPQESTARSP